jgi:hypothetical protein
MAGAIIIGILSSFQAKEIFEFTPEEGICVFTIAYLQVLFIERIIELFSGANVFGNKDEIENAKAESAAATAEARVHEITSRGGCKKEKGGVR